MQPCRRGTILLALIVAAAAFGILSPPVGGVAAVKSIEAGKKMQDSASQGWVSFGSTLYHNGVSHAADTMFKFTNPALGSTSSAWGSLGFASDTTAVNMTVTLIDTYKVTYTVTGAGTQRVYCTSETSPPSVASGGTGTWDAATRILTVTTTGSGTVKIEWNVSSAQSYKSARTLASMLPLLAVFVALGIIKDPSQWRLIVSIAALIAVLAFAGYIFYTWGS